MNPDEGIRGNRIVFNPLNEGERIRGIWQICIPKFSTLGLTSRETSLSGCHPMACCMPSCCIRYINKDREYMSVLQEAQGINVSSSNEKA